MAPSAVSRFPEETGAAMEFSHRDSPQSNNISNSNNVTGNHPNTHATTAHPARSNIPPRVKIHA